MRRLIQLDLLEEVREQDQDQVLPNPDDQAIDDEWDSLFEDDAQVLPNPDDQVVGTWYTWSLDIDDRKVIVKERKVIVKERKPKVREQPQAQVLPNYPANSYIEVKQIKGHHYRYLRWRDGAKLRSRYLGRTEGV